MQSTKPLTPAYLLGQLEELWRALDSYFAEFKPADWQRKHGKDWIFADVPFHVSYYDRLLVARPIEAGESLAESERLNLDSVATLDGWNTAELAKRPLGQTVEQSLQQMRETRDRIRKAATGLSQADFESRKVWNGLAFLRGWRSPAVALQTCRVHTWSHVNELKFRLGKKSSKAGGANTHAAIATFIGWMPVMANASLAPAGGFTAAFNVTGEGGGAWHMRIADGKAFLQDGIPPKPDLRFTASVDTIHKVFWLEVQNPMVALLTRKLKVKGMSKMGTFGKIMPPPKSDIKFLVQEPVNLVP